ncbi:MAG: insulinase family protein [Planctomycetes bacterium]|nr:insulinase family protein [Planctomycetota bacterium]
MDKDIRFTKLSILLLITMIAAGFALLGCDEQIIPREGSIDDVTAPIVTTPPPDIAEAPQTEKLYDYRQIELDNGMKVITVEDFSCPIVAVQVWYHVGSKNEDPARQGFAHMFEHMMFKGTDLVGEQDHFNFIQRVGGSNNAYTGYDTTVYLETLPADQIELALWLESERMNFLKIDQGRFDTERKVVEEELRMGENRPYGTLFKKEVKELFKLHPYKWTPIGKLAHLRAASVAELRAFWTKYYVPNNATLVVVGAVKHNDAQKLARKYFGWIPRMDDPEPVTVREPQKTAPQTIVIDDENAPAGMVEKIWLTVPLGHKDEAVLDLLASILGGGNSSRLYRDIVAERQLAVGADAGTFNLEHSGVFQATATHNPDANTDQILKLIDTHIENIKQNGVTAKELEKAKNKMLKGLVVENLKIDSKARSIGNAAVVKGNPERANDRLNEIRNVTQNDIQRAANYYLDNNKATTFMVRPNTKGAMAGQKDSEESQVTAKPELTPPPTGRKGVKRPDTFAKTAPFAQLKAAKFTPSFTRTRLSNGIKVIVIPNDEVPFVSVMFGTTNGAVTEQKPGTAGMTAKMLTKGTDNYTEAELVNTLEQKAISLHGSANMDTFTVNANCLTEHTDLAVELMAEVVRQPTFDKEEFDKLKKQVITKLQIASQQPRYLVEKQFRKALYHDHPYSRTVEGSVEDVKALTTEHLKSWHECFVQPSGSTIIFSGDITEQKAVELTKKYFKNWIPTVDCDRMTILPPDMKPKDTHIYIVDRPGSVQSEIRIGQAGITRHTPEKYFVSRIVSNYFGWSFNSRLNESIRVKKGLTYGAWGGYNAQNLAGQLKCSTFTKNETTAQTVQAVIDELTILTSKPPTDKELNDSKTYFAGSFVRNRETPQQVAGDLWLIESQKLGDDYLNNLLKTLAKTTKDDCIDLAKETVNTNQLVIVVVGDAKEIKEDLEKIAPVTVVKNDE